MKKKPAKKKIEKRKILILPIIIVTMLIIAGGILFFNFNSPILGLFLGLQEKNNPKGVLEHSIEPIDITYENIPQMLSEHSMIKELPKDAVILLRFYSFDGGKRVWKRSYVLEGGRIREGSVQNPEITLYIHSKYLEPLTNQNFCSIIRQAKINGDLGMESRLPKVKLMWRFKNMLKYKDCLGV